MPLSEIYRLDYSIRTFETNLNQNPRSIKLFPYIIHIYFLSIAFLFANIDIIDSVSSTKYLFLFPNPYLLIIFHSFLTIRLQIHLQYFGKHFLSAADLTHISLEFAFVSAVVD